MSCQWIEPVSSLQVSSPFMTKGHQFRFVLYPLPLSQQIDPTNTYKPRHLLLPSFPTPHSHSFSNLGFIYTPWGSVSVGCRATVLVLSQALWFRFLLASPLFPLYQVLGPGLLEQEIHEGYVCLMSEPFVWYQGQAPSKTSQNCWMLMNQCTESPTETHWTEKAFVCLGHHLRCPQ